MSTEKTNEDIIITDANEAQELASALDLEYLPQLTEVDPPRELIFGEFSKLLGSWARQFKAVPIGEDGNTVIVAMSDPRRIEAVDTLRLCYGRPLRLLVTSEEEIIKAINIFISFIVNIFVICLLVENA